MTVACSGKSSFARKHRQHLGYKIVDFAEQLTETSGIARYVLYLARAMPPLRRLVKNNQSIRERAADRYFDKLYSYLRSLDEPTVVMGRPGPEDLEVCENIVYGAVLIPLERHQRNCQRRKRQLKNPIPFFHHPTTDIRRIEVLRAHLESYAQRHGIPVYESFIEAIAALAADATRPSGRADA